MKNAEMKNAEMKNAGVKNAEMKNTAMKWKLDATRHNSLRLLPLGPDRIGEDTARASFRLCI